MWHWILEHGSAFNDIGLAWIAPVVVVLIAAKVFRPGYRRGEGELVPVPTEEPRTDAQRKSRSAA